jgi:hypothetical protein
MALIIKAQPLRQSQNVWAALIALVQAEVLPRGMNLPANGIIRGVDLLSVGTVCWYCLLSRTDYDTADWTIDSPVNFSQ